MSSKKRLATVGGAARASDFNTAAQVAATADDRALELLVTPHTAQKKVIPLSEETLAGVSPRLLVVGQDIYDPTVPNAKVRVRPAHFIAGVISDPYTIGIGAKSKVSIDSPVVGNNASGSTRTDLLYATINFGTTVSATMRQKPVAGGDPITTPLTVEADPLVTLGIVAGVASGNPLASLPADPGDGSSYNFGLAAITVLNGYAGGAITQASLAQLWNGGFLSRGRVRGYKAGSICTGAANERISQFPYSDRWGADVRMFIPFRSLPATPNATFPGVVLDNSIDWRQRIIYGRLIYYGNGLALSGLDVNESHWVGSPVTGDGTNILTFALQSGLGGVSPATITYDGAASLRIEVYTDGSLQFCRMANLIDAVNGDSFLLMIEATDQLNGAFV